MLETSPLAGIEPRASVTERHHVKHFSEGTVKICSICIWYFLDYNIHYWITNFVVFQTSLWANEQLCRYSVWSHGFFAFFTANDVELLIVKYHDVAEDIYIYSVHVY